MRNKTSPTLRALAVFEAAKGGLVLLLACGWLDLLHKNVDDSAERLAKVLHTNPDGKLSSVFVKLASHATDRVLWMLALGAFVYVAVRFIEAYGLWREREWAQWLAVSFTALYLPLELYWLVRQPSWVKCSMLIANALILLILILRFRLAHRQISFTYRRTREYRTIG